jgi:hypothetical protein
MNKKQNTKVVNLNHEDYDVRIDRRGPWGNPFPITAERTREQAIDEHYDWLEQWFRYGMEVVHGHLSNRWQVEHLHLLKGKRLGCHCAPKPCHGTNYIILIQDLKI